MNDKCPNDATIKYLEERITALDRRLLDYIVESRRALDKAENTLNERLESMNQFRAQILLERANFVTREAFDSHVRDKAAELKSVDEFISNLKGRMTVTGTLVTIMSAIIAALVSLAVKYF